MPKAYDMRNKIKILGVHSKEDIPILAAFVCFLVGFSIQIIVIVSSFSWSQTQFGLPNTTPGLFIIATVLTLIPILGFVTFANFTLIFISTFHSSNLLSHPWFYHLIGMAIFNIGTILFMSMDKIFASRKKADVPPKII
jgi:hypothetical protein